MPPEDNPPAPTPTRLGGVFISWPSRQASGPEAPLPPGVFRQRFIDLSFTKFRPFDIKEQQLSISRLPDQKVTQTQLPRSPDHEVRGRCTRARKMRRNHLLVNILSRDPLAHNFLRCLHQIRA